MCLVNFEVSADKILKARTYKILKSALTNLEVYAEKILKSALTNIKECA